MFPMRARFSLIGLIGVVLFAATACGLVRGFDFEYFAILTVAPIILPLFGIFADQRRTRVFWLSFASVALAYAILSFPNSWFVVRAITELVMIFMRRRLYVGLYAWVYIGVNLAVCVLTALLGGYAARRVYDRLAAPSNNGRVAGAEYSTPQPARPSDS